MAIRIPNLKKLSDSLSETSHIFTDLHLDFKKSGEYNEVLRQKINKNDIQVDYDFNAIKNSIINLFNTKPGQRFLFPRYGLSLEGFLFEAIIESTAENIGNAIVRAIELYETRVAVEMCRVVPNPDDNEYNVTLVLSVPLFKANTTINSVLDVKSQTFKFL